MAAEEAAAMKKNQAREPQVRIRREKERGVVFFFSLSPPILSVSRQAACFFPKCRLFLLPAAAAAATGQLASSFHRAAAAATAAESFLLSSKVTAREAATFTQKVVKRHKHTLLLLLLHVYAIAEFASYLRQKSFCL